MKIKILVPVEVELSVSSEGLPQIDSVILPEKEYLRRFMDVYDEDRMKIACRQSTYYRSEFIKVGNYYVLNEDPDKRWVD